MKTLRYKLLAPAWSLHTSPRRLLLRRAINGSELELSTRDAPVLARILASREGFVANELPRQARALIPLLLEQHALRQGQTDLAPVASFNTWVPLKGHSVRAVGSNVFVMRDGARPCWTCLRLRWLARRGRPGEEQTLKWPTKSSKVPRGRRDALTAEVLRCLDDGPLVPGEVLVAQWGQGISRSRLLEHPDCERCALGLPRTPRPAVTDIRRALTRGPRRVDAAVRQARADYADPVLGPLDIEIDSNAHAFPLKQPFVWGSVFLSRALAGQVACVSTYGGLYGAGVSPEWSKLLATSEGAERLAARGARPHAWHTTPGGRQRRAFCFGVDLTTQKPMRFPFEKIVVGLPRRLVPQGAFSEPFYSGAASHQTFKEAVLHASVELLKRDAFMISWYRKRTLRRVRWPQRPSTLIEQRATYLTDRKIDIELFDLRLELPMPMLLLRLTARRKVGNWPSQGALLIPCGGFTWGEALEHGLNLACGQFVSLGIMPAAFKNPLDPRAVRALARRLPTWPLTARYLDPSRAAAHAFLGQGECTFESLPGKTPRSTEEAFDTLRKWLSTAHLPWGAVRLTDAPATRAGFEVVKVVIPGLMGISPTRAAADFTLPRLHRNWALASSLLPQRDPHPLY